MKVCIVRASILFVCVFYDSFTLADPGFALVAPIHFTGKDPSTVKVCFKQRPEDAVDDILHMHGVRKSAKEVMDYICGHSEGLTLPCTSKIPSEIVNKIEIPLTENSTVSVQIRAGVDRLSQAECICQHLQCNDETKKIVFDSIIGAPARTLREHLLETLFSGADPFDFMDELQYPDDDFPYTNLPSTLASFVVNLQTSLQNRPVNFYLELGTMFGGSLYLAHKANPNMTLLAIDTFLGEVNMWSWAQRKRRPAHLKDSDFLDLHGGQPRIFERFMYNVKKLRYNERVVPFRITSIVGMKLLNRLYSEGHLWQRPEVIYLDAAHEAVETLLEIQEAWCLLTSPGIIYGDDFPWEAVQSDVRKFVAKLGVSAQAAALTEVIIAQTTISGNRTFDIVDQRIMINSGQWLLVKVPDDKSCINAFE